MEDVNKPRRISFSLSKLECGPQEINSMEIRLHLPFSANWNKRDKAWKKREFILKLAFSLQLPSWMLKLPNIINARAVSQVRVPGYHFFPKWAIGQFFKFPVLGSSPRRLCQSLLGPVSFWFVKWRIDYVRIAPLSFQCNQRLEKRQFHLFTYLLLRREMWFKLKFNMYDCG